MDAREKSLDLPEGTGLVVEDETTANRMKKDQREGKKKKAARKASSQRRNQVKRRNEPEGQAWKVFLTITRIYSRPSKVSLMDRVLLIV
jgi:hypothetical protein